MMNLILKAAIIGKYWSQVDFAEAIGTREAVVSRVVRGRQRLSAESQKKWAEALDSNVSDLFPPEA